MHIFALTGGIASGKTTVSNYMKELGCPVIDADLIARQGKWIKESIRSAPLQPRLLITPAVVQLNKPAWKAIVGHFGVEVLLENGQINRPKLGEIVFSNEEKRHLLNTCTHPYITKEIFLQIAKNFLRGRKYIVDCCIPFLLCNDLTLYIRWSICIVGITLALWEWSVHRMGKDDHCCQLVSETSDYRNTFHVLFYSTSSREQQLERLRNRDGFSEEEAQERITSQLSLSEKIRRANYVIDNSQELRFTQQQSFALYHKMRRMSVYCGLFKWLMVLAVLVVTLVAIRFLSWDFSPCLSCIDFINLCYKDYTRKGCL